MEMMQEIRVSQGLRQEIALQIVQSMRFWRAGIDSNVVGMFRDVFQHLADVLRHKREQFYPLVEQIEVWVNDPNMHLFLALEKCAKNFLVASDGDRVRVLESAVLLFFYNVQDGRFQFGDGPNDIVAVEHLLLRKAYFEPGKVQKEHDEIISLMRQGREGAGALQSMQEKRNSMRVAEALKAHVEACLNVLRPLFFGKTNIQEVLVHGAILDVLDRPLSERWFRRYVRSVNAWTTKGKGRRFRRERFREAFLNVVGEYVLLSLGILDQNLFVKQCAQVDQETQGHMREEFAALGINMDELAAKHRLNTEGVWFWQRFALCGKQPSRESDDAVREFITRTVRQAGDALWALPATTQMLDEIVALAPEYEDDDLGELLGELLDDDSFKQLLKNQIVGPWRRHLQDFIVT